MNLKKYKFIDKFYNEFPKSKMGKLAFFQNFNIL